MPLPAGTRVGAYEVLAPLGAGGMGEVYRARDTRLGREVALKILPDEYARDPERLARFGREAQILAALNHPHIAAIHGLEEAGGVRCLVLELVPGRTLAERLEAGPVPVREALEIARQIAEALEAAHERGIIHRDLKPANVKVTPEGAVKVLDFGLAKALETSADPGAAAGAGAVAGQSPAPLSQSPTLTLGATARGIILGTAAYMSPEQARGQTVDRRADIWSFGCVLYELLSGRAAFGGQTISDTLAAVLKSEPEWGALPAETPPRLREILGRCLEKDPRRRRRDIGDVRAEIEWLKMSPGAGEVGGPAGTTARTGVRRRTGAAWLVAGLVALGLLFVSVGWWRARQHAGGPPPVQALEVALGEDETLRLGDALSLALSPDGRHLAYVARKEGVDRLFVRPLDEFGSRPLPDTEGAASPFFSPDGRSIGFMSGGKIRTTSLREGGVRSLGDAEYEWATGGAWSSDGAVLFNDRKLGLAMVSENGGSTESIVRLNHPYRHAAALLPSWPQVLQDSGLLLFTIGGHGRAAEHSSIAVLPPGESSRVDQARIVVEGSSFARYASPGQLIYVRNGSLFAAPFDPWRGTIQGEPRRIVTGVAVTGDTGVAQFAVSDSGLLAYVPGSGSARHRALVWVGRDGVEIPLKVPHRPYVDLNLSPQGDKLVMGIQGGGGESQDLWLVDLRREALTRLTVEPSVDMAPIWSPDGRWIYYCAAAGEQFSLLRRRVDGGGGAEVVWKTDEVLCPTSFSPDGRRVVLNSWMPGADQWILELRPIPTAVRLRETAFRERHPQFSPDGRLLAYVSDESGRDEFYLERVGPSSERVQVSSDGGFEPRWRKSGRELFFRNGDRVLAATVVTQPALEAGKPRVLFEGEYEYGGGVIDYAASADGNRFLMMRGTSAAADPTRNRVIVNWERLLESAPASSEGG